MWTSGSGGSCMSGRGVSDPSASRWWMVARRARIEGFSEKSMSSMPSGAKIRSLITSPRRLPRMLSTTWPAQSMLLPYSHLSPGSNNSGVISDAFEQVTTLGWPRSCARRKPLLLDQPVQHRSRPVCGIGREPLRLETEALLGSLDHGLRRADLGLTNGAGCLYVNNDAALHPDKTTVSPRKKAPSLLTSMPLASPIILRYE